MSRYIFAIFLLVVLSTGISIVLQHPGFALNLLIVSFWVLTLGTIFYIFELKNEK